MPTIYQGPLDVKKGLSLDAENYHITLTRDSDCFLCDIQRTDITRPKLSLRTRLFGDPLRLEAIKRKFITHTRIKVPNIQSLNGTTQIYLSLDNTRGYLRATIANNPQELTGEEQMADKAPEPQIRHTQQIALPEYQPD